MDGNEHRTRAKPAVSRAAEGDPIVLHGSALAWGGYGVLILGASGTGKSGLALRLMASGGILVADDRVLVRRSGEDLLAEAPQPLRGLVEARGVGILRVPYAEVTTLALAVDLERAPEARMPERRKIALLGRTIDLIFGFGVPNLDAIITVIAQNRADVV